MTREEALKLQVGKSKVFVVDHKLEEFYEITVTRIELESYSIFSSDIKITGTRKTMAQPRVYSPSEVCATEIEALQKLRDIHQLRSDQAHRKKVQVLARIAKLKGGRDEA